MIGVGGEGGFRGIFLFILYVKIWKIEYFVLKCFVDKIVFVLVVKLK